MAIVGKSGSGEVHDIQRSYNSLKSIKSDFPTVRLSDFPTYYSLKYIQACLNSKLLNYFYSSIFFGWQVTIPALNLMPIKNVDFTDQEPFINLVDEIHTITKEEDFSHSPSKQTKVKELENQIDRLVYELYELTQKEIALVEAFSK